MSIPEPQRDETIADQPADPLTAAKPTSGSEAYLTDILAQMNRESDEKIEGIIQAEKEKHARLGKEKKTIPAKEKKAAKPAARQHKQPSHLDENTSSPRADQSTSVQSTPIRPVSSRPASVQPASVQPASVQPASVQTHKPNKSAGRPSSPFSESGASPETVMKDPPESFFDVQKPKIEVAGTMRQPESFLPTREIAPSKPTTPPRNARKLTPVTPAQNTIRTEDTSPAAPRKLSTVVSSKAPTPVVTDETPSKSCKSASVLPAAVPHPPTPGWFERSEKVFSHEEMQEHFGRPLPGPKPEWAYRRPKQPIPSRAYLADSEDRYVIFKSQDNAPYSAMGLRDAEDKQAQARFIMSHTNPGGTVLRKQSQRRNSTSSTRPTTQANVNSPAIKDLRPVACETARFDLDIVHGFMRKYNATVIDIQKSLQATRHSLNTVNEFGKLLLWSLWSALIWIFSRVVANIRRLLTLSLAIVIIFGLFNDWLSAVGLDHTFKGPKVVVPSVNSSALLSKSPSIYTTLYPTAVTSKPAVQASSSSPSSSTAFTGPSKTSTSYVITGIDALLRWGYILLVFWKDFDLPFASRVLDPRLVGTLIVVLAILLFVEIYREEIRSAVESFSIVLVNINEYLYSGALKTITFAYDTSATVPRAVFTFLAALRLMPWRIIRHCYTKGRKGLSQWWTAFTTLLCNTPYLLVWYFINPVTGTLRILIYLFGYVIQFILFWPWLCMQLWSRVWGAIAWILTKVRLGALWLTDWIPRTYRKVEIDTAASKAPRLQCLLLRCQKFLKQSTKCFGWLAFFIIWSLFVFMLGFLLGVGFRDVYDGFEKVVIAASPCDPLA